MTYLSGIAIFDFFIYQRIFAALQTYAFFMKKKGYHVTYDSNNGNEFVIHKPDKATQVFKQSERGIYFLDTADSAKNITLVNIVDNNKSTS